MPVKSRLHSIRGRESSPVGRPDFKPGEGRLTFLVGSTPTHFRQYIAAPGAAGCNGAAQGGP